jgi:sporulation protein YlmC with PRC-barrel domain
MHLPERMSSQQTSEESTWLASRLLRRQVVNVVAAEPAGRVTDLIFDPDNGQVMALIVESERRTEAKSRFPGGIFRRKFAPATVGLDHIISMESDVVTVNANPFNLAHSRELERLSHLNKTCEMPIVTMRGVCLGTLADLLLEDRGATIAGYVVNPTQEGEDLLPTLDEQVATDAGITDNEQALRVIPPHSRLRVGSSLIMLLEELVPLRELYVVMSQNDIAAQSAQAQSTAGRTALNGAGS